MRNNNNQRSRSISRFSLSTTFDDGEILAQSGTLKSINEYVVQSSTTDVPFDEYVVVGSVPLVSEQSVDVNLFYTPALTYNTPPDYTSSVSNTRNDAERLSLLDNISVRNEPISTKPAVSAESSFEYMDAQEEISKSTSDNEDDFAKDMQAILTGQKVFDPVNKKTVEKSSLGAPAQNSQQKSNSAPPPVENKHAIFDQIAQSMEYAKAYDLGSIDLEKRFSDFDKILDLQQAVPAEKSVKVSTTKSTIDSEDFIKDLDAIARASSANNAPSPKTATVEDNAGKLASPTPSSNSIPSPDFPVRPANLRPLTAQERTQLYGTFPYESDPTTFGGDGIRVTNDWRGQNIIAVPIPQLNGKLMNGQPIENGAIHFHRAGATALQNLWSAWQEAGLLDKILNFQGGYAARYIRNTQSRTPRPLSNHAWGTAFDINANWNAYGRQPALAGQQGSVRELVGIANRHGFFWGGHFRGSLDGMHFELGKITN